MSYILDALKKAAEQRSGPPAEVRRLLAPAAVPETSPLRYMTVTAIGIGVIVLAAAAVWIWIPGNEAPTATTAPVPSVAAVAAPTATPPATVADEQSRVPADKKARVPVAIESRSEPPPTTGGETRSAPAKARATETTPRRTPAPTAPSPAPPGAISPAPPAPAVTVLPPTAAATASRAEPGKPAEVSKLKVEVIVYSEERPLRWAFISGRRYTEGDAIGGGARVEEIQPNGVVLVEDGRRVTLRP